MLTFKEWNLKEGFSFAYLSLLKFIAANDLQAIGGCCEKNLYRAIAEGLNDLNRDVERIEILNEDQFPYNIIMSVIDFQ
jgi:hypothetical protein